MPISMSCDCGRSLRVKDEFAGRKVKCPQCGAVLAVPAPEPSSENEALDVLLADDPQEEARPRQKNYLPDPEEMVQTAPGAARGTVAGRAEEERARRRREQEREEERRRERRREGARREERRKGPRVAFSEGWFGSTNSGVVGGVLMIVIAVVWFGLGLLANRIFFYPPILAVIGIASIVKGIANR
jgi:hypothetical protein